MQRDVELLTQKKYDLLVIGGGIHGLFAAYDAAGRGLSVALVDAADFGSGLTFNHQRTIHGGLRMMQKGRWGQARRDLLERRTWAQIAPHYLRPLPFLIGTYRFTRRSRWLLKAGFALYERLGRHRNSGVPAELHLPRPRLESAAATRRLFPGVDERGLSGGAVWYDYQTRHPDRLTWTVALAAAARGATLANYVEAVGPLKNGARVAGAKVVDRLTGKTHDLEASTTLLAAGSELPAVMTAFGVSGAPPYLRAMNLLLDRPARDIAVVAATPRGRMLTAVPWSGFVLVGTHQSPAVVSSGDRTPPPEAVDVALAEANATFPRLAAKRSDVRVVHHGLVPAHVKAGAVDLLAQPNVIRHETQGTAGLVSLVGVKYTSARAAAANAVDGICRELGRSNRSRTTRAPLPHAGVADVEGRLIETSRELGVTLDRDILDHLTGWYGTEASDVLRHAVTTKLLHRLRPGLPVLAGEIDYVALNAQAVHLGDAVLRRTPLGSAGHPGADALAAAAAVMAARFHWPAERLADEVRQVEAVYPPK